MARGLPGRGAEPELPAVSMWQPKAVHAVQDGRALTHPCIQSLRRFGGPPACSKGLASYPSSDSQFEPESACTAISQALKVMQQRQGSGPRLAGAHAGDALCCRITASHTPRHQRLQVQPHGCGAVHTPQLTEKCALDCISTSPACPRLDPPPPEAACSRPAQFPQLFLMGFLLGLLSILGDLCRRPSARCSSPPPPRPSS